MEGAAMQTRTLLAGLLCVVLTAIAAAAPKPKGVGTVAGEVLAPDDKPVAGAHVTLQTSEGHHLQTAETNDKGRFWFASLPEGQYDVRGSFEGRVTEWRQGVWVAPAEMTWVVLHLRPKKSP